MSGIYIHIPFCRQACHYCDFHFSTNLKNVDALVKALCMEIELRQDYLEHQKVDTLYFGGGTPSLLKQGHLDSLFSVINKNFQLSPEAEITLEANPEDVTKEAISHWKSFGINRISIGIQTFNDDKLKLINRAHDAEQARKALGLIASDFKNYNADLIYAIPPSAPHLWQNDLDELLSFDPPHVSMYGLTIEDKTVFGKWVEQGKFSEVPENENADAYQQAIDALEAKGYEHYEISNFCLPGKYSKHNTSYWKGASYLGIGPGAHSFDGLSRSWNVRNNFKYIKAIHVGIPDSSREILSFADRQNEFVLTRIRNKWGIDLKEFHARFGKDFHSVNAPFTKQLIDGQMAYVRGDHFYLTQKGWFLADEITERLMI